MMPKKKEPFQSSEGKPRALPPVPGDSYGDLDEHDYSADVLDVADSLGDGTFVTQTHLVE